ncbi:MAG: FAD-dependent monooxygenase [Tetrasphaera sp.]|nr:FAD-dependent monooxygenase [Tetrasphaera sp.]
MTTAQRSPDDGVPDLHADVLVVGAGPVGLTLALELDRYGVDTLLIDKSLTATRHPKMDITNGRSMEIFRRLGVVDMLRAVAVPEERRMTVSWATGVGGWELARFVYPSVLEQRQDIETVNDGTLSLEPSMRVSQVLLEPVLRAEADRATHIRTAYGWGLESFDQSADGVTATLVESARGQRRRVHAAYLLGCDGAGSAVRRHLGIGLGAIDLRRHLAGDLGRSRVLPAMARNLRAGVRPLSGRFHLIHFHTCDREIERRFGPIWHLQSPAGWTLISQDDAGTYTLHVPIGVGEKTAGTDPAELVQRVLGHRFALEVLQANEWTPRLTVADRYGQGRVWLAGDAVHQVPPTGGYGMNTGVGDAVGLAWAVAGQVQGWGGPGLLAAYERERRGVALRNRIAAARHSTVRAAIHISRWGGMHHEGWRGEQTRRGLGQLIRDLGNLENEAWGIELGYCYDGSPVVWGDGDTGAAAPTDRYVPTTRPGARPPSVILDDGTALFDRFGVGFTLVRFADVDVSALAAAAEVCRVPLTVVDVRDRRARDLYERDLVLVRPDQHVAWRGDRLPDDPAAVIDRVRGVARRGTR